MDEHGSGKGKYNKAVGDPTAVALVFGGTFDMTISITSIFVSCQNQWYLITIEPGRSFDLGNILDFY